MFVSLFFRIIIFGGKFEILFTGLKRALGSPIEYNKITFDGATLAKIETYDVTIPIDETDQGAAKDESEIDVNGALEDGDGVGPLHKPPQLESQLDQMKIKSQSSMST